MVARPLERLAEWKFASLIKFSFQLARRIARSRRDISYLVVKFCFHLSAGLTGREYSNTCGKCQTRIFSLGNHRPHHLTDSFILYKHEKISTLRFDSTKVTAREIQSVENFSVSFFLFFFS